VSVSTGKIRVLIVGRKFQAEIENDNLSGVSGEGLVSITKTMPWDMAKGFTMVIGDALFFAKFFCEIK
jgi:hypothetical protein